MRCSPVRSRHPPWLHVAGQSLEGLARLNWSHDYQNKLPGVCYLCSLDNLCWYDTACGNEESTGQAWVAADLRQQCSRAPRGDRVWREIMFWKAGERREGITPALML
ncbi:hypothetical protein BCR34DRAFT_553047 [Clohesyomyces aquaticus]|uniref:Uncharacterized protein n=1 Tax=Clohesyomyces aquaticus TaxID=1231657 RepID=A0A1Y2A8Y4_9PLEO|nr:hypothetical protein BCR34DRAFT_553047 [Clohesyomyces aquaticus]